MLRKQLRAQPTIEQAIISKRVATVMNHTTIPCPTTIPLNNNQVVIEKQRKLDDTFFIHCTHEARLGALKRDIHEIHNSLFSQTPNANTRLIVGHRNNPNLEFELSQKRPSSSLLKNVPNKSKYETNSNLLKLLFLLMY